MQLGYTILYVPDVPATLKFYEAAFGLTTRFLHEGGDYGELEHRQHHAGVFGPQPDAAAGQKPAACQPHSALFRDCAVHRRTCPPRWSAPLPPGPSPCARWS
jgi:catechol 2,3-dioxygenase-like lactoylglutathione lyase family enzyme